MRPAPGAEPLGRHRLAFSRAAASNFSACWRVTSLQSARPRLGFGNDLPGLASGASVKLRHQLTHRPIAAGIKQLVECRGVVPMR